MMPLSENERRILAEIETEFEHPRRATRAWLAARVRAFAVVVAVLTATVLGCLAAVAQAQPAVAAGITGVLGVVASGCLLLAVSRTARLAVAKPWYRVVGRARHRWS
jgi:hypothetical protein